MTNSLRLFELRFWILPEGAGAPIGPMTIDDIRGRLAKGQLQANDLACRESDTAWIPLAQLLAPGLAQRSEIPVRPVPTAPSPSKSAQVSEGQSANSAVAQGTTNRPIGLVGILIGATALAILICAVAYWFKPLTASQTAEQFLTATAVGDAKAVCTIKVEPAAEAMFRVRSAGRPSRFEFLEEGPAPVDLGGYLVQFRATSFSRGGGRQSNIQGLVHLLNAKSWKVEDVYLTAVDSQACDPPISLALDYRWFLHPQNTPPPANKAQPNNTTGALHGARFLASRSKGFFESPAVKWIGGLCIAAAAAVFGVRSNKKETNDKTTST